MSLQSLGFVDSLSVCTPHFGEAKFPSIITKAEYDFTSIPPEVNATATFLVVVE